MTDTNIETSTGTAPAAPVATPPPALGMKDQMRLQHVQRKTNNLLWGIFILLLVLVGGVVFILPNYVAPAAPDVTVAAPAASAPAAPQEPPATPFEDAQRQRQREEAQNTLASLLEEQDVLVDKQVAQWAETEFNAALEQARNGDTAYASQQYTDANALYQKALEQLKQISANQTNIYNDFIAKGAAAYQAEDATGAQAAYSQALLIDPGSADAFNGLHRADVLKQVLALLEQGRNEEQNGQIDQARATYQQALALDNAHAGANAALAALSANQVERNFAAAMSRGFAALQSNNADEAQSAFQQALSIKPSASTEVETAMQQARDQQTFAAISAHIESANSHEQNERWEQALAAWNAALTVDPSLATAIDGKRRAEARNNLDRILETAITDPLRLAEDNIYEQTVQILGAAEQQIQNPGPRLAGQIQKVHAFLDKARVPVTVQLQSDGVTAVTLYRVGELGQFTTHSLDLRPGTYTAVGVRAGYRDVRQEFVVSIDGQAPVVTIACSEAI